MQQVADVEETDIDTDVVLRTGTRMPALGLGTWQLHDHTADTVMEAFEFGYTMIDTSGDYGTQSGIGKAIARSSVQREQLFLTTKVEETDDAYEATCMNLEELGLEYTDLVLIHRPPAFGYGEDLWRGLIRARNEGLTTDIGVSNYSMHYIRKLIEVTGEVPAVNQIEWSPFGHSEEMFRYAQELDIIIQAYSPLTRGKRLHDEEIKGIAKRHNKTPAQILIRWNIERGVVPLPKANKRSHLKENIEVFDFELSERDIAVLDDLNERYSALGSLPYV